MSDTLTLDELQQKLDAHRVLYPQSKIAPDLVARMSRLHNEFGVDGTPSLKAVLDEQMHFEELVFRDKVPYDRALYESHQKFQPGTISVVTPVKGKPYCAGCKAPVADVAKPAHACPGWREPKTTA